ncbi:MAG: 3-oxoacyl-ACP reductase family protein [Candidatus Omnitrophota bacterium]|jgi:3-oxoacyl-[acyl-carrier protein] reductase
MLLKDRNIMISGASRGIGRAIALELAKEGANISFSFANSVKEAQELEKEINALGVKGKAFQVDIRDFEAVKAWVEETKIFLGSLDTVINNAGIVKDKALALMDVSEWRDVLSTNLDGVFNLSRSAIITFLKQKNGNIVNITSVSGVVGLPRQTNYSASKAGIIGFTKALAKEVAPYGVRVNAIAPGFIDTDMIKDLKEEHKAQILKHVPLARLGKAEEVAKVVKFLISDASKYITGQTIIIDGGMSIA